VTLSAAVVASWARYAEGVDEQGEPIEIDDQLADTVQRLAAQQRDNPLAFVKYRELFGDLATEPAFTEPYLNALDALHTRGARATLEALAARSTAV
jgi:mannitol 2-dehydrogenase